MRVPLLGPSYVAQSQFLSNEESINLMFEPGPEGAVSPGMLIGTAGIGSWCEVGVSGTCRGLYRMADTLYAVYGTTLYSVASSGVETSLGTVAGTEPVVFADNGTQLVVVADTTSYSYNTATSTFAQITDDDFLQASSVAYLDGMFVFSQTNSWVFFISPVISAGGSTVDLAAFDGADYSIAYTSPENIVRVLSDHKELWVFKEKSIEVWQNTGEVDFPLSRLGGAFVQRGCAAKHSVLSEDNSVLWLGDDLVVYRAQGYIPQRISSPAVEAAIASYGTVDDARAFTWDEAGHKLYGLTFPTEGVTWVYDFSTGLWHKRQSFGYGWWRAVNTVKCYGRWFVGDLIANVIGELSTDIFEEYGTMQQSIRVGKHITAQGAPFSVDRLHVMCEAGVGLTSGQGSDPQIALFISSDFGKSYGTQKNRELGAQGAWRTQAVWRNQGLYRQFTPKLLISDPVRRVILDAFAEITPRLP